MLLPERMSPEGRAFVRHWSDLREKDALVARSRNFLDNFDPRFQPFVSFHDQERDGPNVIRLFGTALARGWGHDLTGKTLEEIFPPVVSLAFANSQMHCTSLPCGMWERAEYVTNTGRDNAMEVTTLPLSVDRLNVTRLVRFHHISTRLETPDERLVAHVKSTDKTWFSIGAGVPPDGPVFVGQSVASLIRQDLL